MHPAVNSSNKASMSVSRNPILSDALFLLFRYLKPASLILFASITALVLPFQHPKTNGVRHHGVRQRISGMDYMGWESSMSSRSISPSYKIPIETYLRLSASPEPSYSHFTQQQRAPGTEVKNRDMASLSEWSRSCEIVLANGVEVVEDLLGDWSLTTTKSIEQGSSIMTVPSQVILTSDINGDSYLPYYGEKDMQNVHDWMESQLESGSQSKQDYLPEYMLVYKLLREVHMGTSSRWYPWLQSLPTQFSTGLFLDEVERNYVERMTGEYIRVQDLQYQACLKLFQKLISSQKSSATKTLIPTNFLEWILALRQDSNNEDTGFDNVIKWAFTIVFTRSWRSPDRKQAQIVPLGDLANHDSQCANLKPGFRQTDGALQFFVTNDIDILGPISPKLYLSYGLTYSPARYLVIFGFCDVTAAYIDAQLDFLQANDDCEWPTTLEPSQLVASTLNGALSEEVWVAFLYKILQENDPDLLSLIRNAFDDSKERGDQLVEEVLETWEFEVGIEIQAYYQRLLETDFMPITVTEKDLAEHPNLSMIVNYNLFIRETYLNVLEHVNLFLTQCNEFQSLSTARDKIEIGTVAQKTKENSILQSELNLSERSNQTSASSESDSVSKTSENKSFQSVSGQLASSTPNSIDSTDMKRDSSLPFKTSKNASISAQSVQGKNIPNAASSFSTEYLDQHSDSVQESREMVDLKNTHEINGIETDQLSSTQGEIPEGRSNSNMTSKFSFENFSLQSYSKATPKSYDGGSDQQNYYLRKMEPIGIEQEISPSIPTGNFNPKFYNASKTGTTQENIDSTATSTIPSRNIEPQSYSDATPKYPDGNSYPQSSQKRNDSSEIPQVDYGNSDSQFNSNGQTTPTNETHQFNYGNSNSQSYPNGETTSKNERIDPTVTSGSPKNGNMDFQSYSDGQTLPTQERIDSIITSGFPNTNIGSQSYYSGETTLTNEDSTVTSGSPNNLNEDSQSYSINKTEPSQDGEDFVSSYAQSLVSDQRGHSSVQQQSDGGNQSSKQNADIPSKPTTYAEYVQQRQGEPVFTSDQPCLDASTTESFPLDDSDVRANDGESNQYSGVTIDEYDDFQFRNS